MIFQRHVGAFLVSLNAKPHEERGSTNYIRNRYSAKYA